jgi:hypothetical protein
MKIHSDYLLTKISELVINNENKNIKNADNLVSVKSGQVEGLK